MTKRMLVDATHPEETRIAIVDGNWLDDFDFERASKKQLKGNIYLAKVIRIEPSLQAAFVEYGGNRHGFLPFSEIHPDYFRIPVGDRPHDEVDADDDHQDDDSQQPDISAYADEMEPEPHAEADIPVEPAVEPVPLTGTPAVAAEMPAVPALPVEPTAPIPGFGYNPVDHTHHDPMHDLGLITDFGNAALPVDSIAMPEATSIETVGGEVAEVEEQRIRRPARPRYKIQEVVKRRQVMLIQVVKEERGNKGAALTSFLSLAGRYCVLMPNTDHGGGVSRKITSHQDRRRMKEILDQLEIPEGMAVILRTAGMEQEITEIQRDLEYLLRLWNNIREETLQSTAPALIYEEANLIKRSLRDMSARDLSEILVAGEKGFQVAADFMKTIMPDQVEKIKLYNDPIPLFFRFNIEKQIDKLFDPVVQLRSGGYLVINPTEALVSIDVNSGRATRERHIESTALKTNLEAADEVARQLRLRDLAGLVVIDFIDMEDGRNNAAVERRLKEAMRTDRARLQIGRISPFGLMELSRQRLRPSLTEINFEKCPHCAGQGLIRSIDSAAISILRVIEEEGIKNGDSEIVLRVPTKVALYLLNQKRIALSDLERRYGLQVLLHSDDELVAPDYKLERVRAQGQQQRAAVNTDQVFADTNRDLPPPDFSDPTPPVREYRGNTSQGEGSNQPQRDFNNRDGDRERSDRGGRGRYGRRRGRGGQGGSQGGGRGGEHYNRDGNREQHQPHNEANGNVVHPLTEPNDNIGNTENHTPQGDQNQQRREGGGRRRGRRGGRGRRNGQSGDRPWQPRENREGGQPHQQHPQGEWKTPPQAAAPPPAPRPTSIHDLDTTPRPNSSLASSTPTTPSPYQVVSEPAADKPKGGWWRKLTGQ